MTQNKAKRSPFIQGFKQPTLTKSNFVILADIRGDGENKLVVWQEQQHQLIVYKGSNRQMEKISKISNASGLITYFDEQRSSKSVIGISAQNGLYIFRSMNESFRLRIPDIFALQQEQFLWSQYEHEPQMLGRSLIKIKPNLISQTGKHFLSATTEQRKLQLIQKVFSQGINQKDSISAMCNLRQSPNSVGNIIIGTELNRLYILDCFGHTIIDERVIDSAPVILLSYGSYSDNYIIISIDREGEAAFHLKGNKQEAAEKLKLSCRVISADLNYPDLIISTEDQVVSMYTLSKNYSKLHTKKYSFKLPKQPIKVNLIEFKSKKLTLIVFQDQFRILNEKQLIYTFVSPNAIYDVLFGSFAKEENCIIIMYENHGFQVMIFHRQFNPAQNYGSNKRAIQSNEDIQIPKKTLQFKSYWNQEKDSSQAYKAYERNIKLLKWTTYRQKFSQKLTAEAQIKINSKILGLGPDFTVKLTIQNQSEQPLRKISVIPVYKRNNLLITKILRQIPMLTPNLEYHFDVKIVSLTLKNQTIDFQLYYGNNCSKATVHIPNCQQFADH